MSAREVLASPRECWGYCNLLAHRYAVNDKGAKLVRIVLFHVDVDLAHPTVDAMEHYREQQEMTESPLRLQGAYRSDQSQAASTQIWPDEYEFDVRRWEGWKLW